MLLVKKKRIHHYDNWISSFTTEIVDLAGSDNKIADAFSRTNATYVCMSDLQSSQEANNELKTLLEGDNSLKLQKVNLNDVLV